MSLRRVNETLKKLALKLTFDGQPENFFQNSRLSLTPTFLTVTSVKPNFGGGMVEPICDSSHNLVKAVCWL